MDTSTTTTPGFLTRDPIGYEGGIDLYRFVNGNPLHYLDPDGLVESSIDGIGLTKKCGELHVDWKNKASVGERFLVQLICFEINTVYCERKDGCCKGTRRDACKVCYFELLLDRNRRGRGNGENIDEWRYGGPPAPTVPAEWECGTRGSIKISTEIRGFGENANVALGVQGGPKKFYKCGNSSIQGNQESAPSDDPNVMTWWNTNTSSISTFVNLVWNCCGDNRQKGTYGTSEDVP